jgi:hypothetical protein
MSKVKITGNASGTGVLTIEAPNTNTDRTISLPDSTDTLVGQSTTNALAAADTALAAADTALTTRVNAVGGRKNLIINGGFDVWQRGTTGNADNTFVYASADRWEMVRSSINKATDSSGKTYANVVCGNWADNNYISQHIEGTNEMSGKTLTFSFTISSSTLSDGRVYIRHLNGSTWTTAVWSNIFTYSSTDTIKTYTFTLPSTKIDQIQVYIYGHASTSNENGKSFNIKNVQLEVGSVATDFEHRSYGEELALCQRYYHKVGGSLSYSALLTGASSMGSTELVGFVYHPVTMRVNPSFSLDNITNMEFRKDNDTSFTLQAFTPPNTWSTTKTAMIWFGSQSTVGTGYSGFIRVKNGETASISFDAEL